MRALYCFLLLSFSALSPGVRFRRGREEGKIFLVHAYICSFSSTRFISRLKIKSEIFNWEYRLQKMFAFSTIIFRFRRHKHRCNKIHSRPFAPGARIYQSLALDRSGGCMSFFPWYRLDVDDNQTRMGVTAATRVVPRSPTKPCLPGLVWEASTPGLSGSVPVTEPLLIFFTSR